MRSDAPRQPRWSVLVALVLLTTVLAACIELPAARLDIDVDDVSIGLGAPAFLAVANGGAPGSVLRYRLESDADWLLTEPAGGRLEAGDADTVLITIRPDAAPAPGLTTLLRLNSNAGAETILVRVERDLGPSVCAHGLVGPPVRTVTTVATTGAVRRPAPTALPLDVLVTYHHGTDLTPLARASLAGDVAARAGARLLRAGAPGQHDLLRLPDARADAVLAALERDPRVALVTPNTAVHRLELAPDDPHYPDQWWAWCFGLPQAWAINPGIAPPGSDPIVVAVIDDGFNATHLDLATKLLPGYDLHERNPDVRTISPHGTHVAGIALATGDNATAIAGTAYGPDILLLPVKVFPDDPRANGTLDTLISGMRWAAGLPVAGAPPNPHPADVINLSLGVGSSPPSSTAALLEATIADLFDLGIATVAAAGNRGTPDGVEYPARAQHAIAVGSVDWTGLRSPFSTHGAGLDLMAPGGAAHPATASACRHVLSLGPTSDAGLHCQPGTSMATPVVTGAAALLIAHDPTTYRNDPAAIRQRLLTTALRDDGMSEHEYGAGITCPDTALGATSHCGWPDLDPSLR